MGALFTHTSVNDGEPSAPNGLLNLNILDFMISLGRLLLCPQIKDSKMTVVQKVALITMGLVIMASQCRYPPHANGMAILYSK